MQIFVNRPALRDRLVEYYRAYRAAATETPPDRTIYVAQGRPPAIRGIWRDIPRSDPGKPVKEAYCEGDGVRVILKKETHVQIYLTLADVLIAGELMTHFNQVVNLINLEFGKVKLQEGYRLLHAAGVVFPQGGMALAGAPGAGKSSACLWLLEAGFRFLSNDRLLVKSRDLEVRMVGYPKMPRVNPGTLLAHPRLRGLLTESETQTYRGMDAGALQRLEQKHDVDVEQLFGPGTIQPAGSLTHLILLNWRWGGQGWEVRRLSAEEALDWVEVLHRDMGAYGLERDPGSRTAPDRKIYREIFERIAVVEISGGVDFAKLVETVKGLQAA
jgi:HprK-related kinase B